MQVAISERDVAVRKLLQHTIQHVLEEEITSFLDADTYSGQRAEKVNRMAISLERGGFYKDKERHWRGNFIGQQFYPSWRLPKGSPSRL